MKKVKKIIALLFVVMSIDAFSQGQGNHWYFGYGAGLDFSSGPPVTDLNGALNTWEGCSSVSSASGSLLFYTDGSFVYDKNHQLMPNGTGLLGNASSAQSAIIVQKPGSSKIYYVFTTPAVSAGGMYFSEVDMSLNGGLGDVIFSTKNTLLLTSTGERMTVANHKNGLYKWVIAINNIDGKYNSFLIDCNGVSITAIESYVSNIGTGMNAGSMVASLDGKKIASTGFVNINGIEISNFDNGTGVLSNPIFSILPVYSYGICFSPNSNLLYVTNSPSGQVNQYNLLAGSSAAIFASQTTIGTFAPGGPWIGGALQLGPDSKIYCAENGLTNLSVIHNPNTLGIGCNFQLDAVSLGGKICGLGLPTFYLDFLEKKFSSNFHCLNATTTFSVNGDSTVYTGVSWNFNDPSTGTLNTSNIYNTSHVFSDTGLYNVSMIRYFTCGSDTTFQKIHIVNSPTITVNSATICAVGTTTLNATGANTYTWSNLQTGSSVTVAPTSTTIYTVMGMDVSGCSAIAQSTIVVSPSPTLQVNTVSTTPCSSPNTTIVATGATNYSWSPNINLSATSGSVVVANPNITTQYQVVATLGGCSQTQSITVEPKLFINATITQTNVTCNGGNNGVASVNTNSNSAYNYIWNTSPLQTSSTATNLTAGFYSVVITPTACTPSGIELVTNGDFETGNVSFTNTYTYNPTCSAGGFLGSSTQPDYYDVNPITTCYGLTDRNGGNGNVLHFVDLQGANAGATMWKQTVNVSTNKQYTFSFWAYDGGGCNFQTLGANFDVYINNILIQSTNTGGCGTWFNKMFSWSSNTNTQAILEIRSGATNFNLGIAGMDPAFDDFSFQECIVQGCPTTATVQITEPLPLVITASSSTICVGQQTATLTANGANTYTWSSGQIGSSITQTATANTTYTVLGTDANGCSNYTTTTLFVNPLPNLSANSTTICIGQQTATLTANGATSYTWSTLQTGTSITTSPTVNTTYTVVGTNTNGCYNYTTATVQVYNLPIVSSTSASICAGQQTATLTANGATTYTWSTNQTSNSITQSPTVTTTYSVIGTDVNGCYNYTTAIVQVNSLPIITVNSSTICLGQQIATLTANGATTYTWSANQNSNSITQSPTITTTYTVIGTDNNNCYSNATSTINVLSLPNIIATSALGNTVCPSSTITLNSTGASNYTWSPTPLLSSPNGSLAVFAPLLNTTYTVIGVNGNCVSEQTINITIANSPTITVTSATICSEQSANLTASGAVSYTWLPSGSLNTVNGNNVMTSPLSTTIYSISGSSNLGCVGTTTTQVDVIATPSITINQIPSGIIEFGSTAQLVATISSVNYTWSPTSFLSCSTCTNPIASPSLTTSYCVLSENGMCTNSVCITVEVEKPCATNLTLGLPNAFSPNGDGQNDEYCLQGWNDCVTSFSMLIFDRWGEKIFETTDPNFCWDGTWKGKLLDPAVFVYYAKATFISGSDFNKKGNITLIK